MRLVGPLVAAALAAGVEVGAVLAAETQCKDLAFGIELSRPGESHLPSMVGLGPPVNLLCLRA